MKREICAPEVPASQMVLTIITDEQLEAFADAVITKYQQTIVRHKAAEKPQEEWMTRKEVMALLKRCDSTMTKWARRGYLVPSMVEGGKGVDPAHCLCRGIRSRSHRNHLRPGQYFAAVPWKPPQLSLRLAHVPCHDGLVQDKV